MAYTPEMAAIRNAKSVVHTTRQIRVRMQSRDPRVIVDLAREFTTKAIETLADLMLDVSQPGPVRVRCAELLLERGYGKAPQALLIASEDASRPNGVHGLSIQERIAGLLAAKSAPGQTVDLEASQLSELSSGDDSGIDLPTKNDVI